MAGGFVVSFLTLFDRAVSVVRADATESIAVTRIGFIATGVFGIIADLASPIAQAVRSATAVAPGAKREIICMLVEQGEWRV